MLQDVWLLLSVVTLAIIAVDCVRRPQHMGVMNVTWPLTALYFGPIAGWLYAAYGRSAPKSHHHHEGHGAHHHDMHHDHHAMAGDDHEASARSTFVSTTHCGGGCVLGDLIGESVVSALSLTLFGSMLIAGWTVDFVLAFMLGVAFQYWSIRPMQPDMTPGMALRAALKADTLSILAFQVGMFVVMGLRAVLAPGLTVADSDFWIWMQAAMLVGFATSFPANRWLVRKGLKHAM